MLASLPTPLTGDCGPATHDISPGHASIHAHVNPTGGCLGPFMRTLTHLVERGRWCPASTRWV